MGKKRKRAPNRAADFELSANFFDHPVEPSPALLGQALSGSEQAPPGDGERPKEAAVATDSPRRSEEPAEDSDRDVPFGGENEVAAHNFGPRSGRGVKPGGSAPAHESLTRARQAPRACAGQGDSFAALETSVESTAVDEAAGRAAGLEVGDASSSTPGTPTDASPSSTGEAVDDSSDVIVLSDSSDASSDADISETVAPYATNALTRQARGELDEDDVTETGFSEVAPPPPAKSGASERRGRKASGNAGTDPAAPGWSASVSPEDHSSVVYSSETSAPWSAGSSLAARPASRSLSPPPPPVAVTIIKHLPDNKWEMQEKQWGTKDSFYALERLFGRDSVFVYNGSPVLKSQSPALVDPNASAMVIHVYSSAQWREKELADEYEVEAELRSDPHVALSSDPNVRQDEDQFPITLEGKEGKTRALVAQSMSCENVARLWLEHVQLPLNTHVRVVFDGDELDLDSTLADIDIEEDDKLDIYVANM